MDLNEKSDDTSEDVNSDEIVLRDYQIPLARDAMLGKNVIIIAPTGSGKTYVAMAIVKARVYTKITRIVFIFKLTLTQCIS